VPLTTGYADYPLNGDPHQHCPQGEEYGGDGVATCRPEPSRSVPIRWHGPDTEGPAVKLPMATETCQPHEHEHGTPDQLDPPHLDFNPDATAASSTDLVIDRVGQTLSDPAAG
jgi:hypothetical protein